MKQEGALETKIYMDNYWRPLGGFFPLNKGIFGFTAMFLYKMAIYFFSSYEIIAMIMILIFMYVVVRMIWKWTYQGEDLILVLILGIAVHIVLNLLRLYPLMDRLYVYWFPIFVFLLIIGLQHLRIKKWSLIIAIIIGFSYFTYIPFKRNDVVSLYRLLAKNGAEKIYTNKHTAKEIGYFHRFTDHWFNTERLTIEISDNPSESGGYFVSQVNHRFGHKDETAAEPKDVQTLIDRDKIEIIEDVDGYNIYKIK
jgi:hypothetical protein